MKMETNKAYGAAIERGEIAGKEGTGYIVESYCRKGVTSPPLAPIDGSTYATGDKVYFFMFDDGKGAILTKI